MGWKIGLICHLAKSEFWAGRIVLPTSFRDLIKRPPFKRKTDKSPVEFRQEFMV